MHIMYIYNLLETDFANKVCMKDNRAYRVRLLENFHSRTINQARDVGGLCMSSIRYTLSLTGIRSL